MEYRELERAWGILHIAIAYPKYVTPEQASELWDKGKLGSKYRNSDFDEELIRLRKSGLTYREISQMMGLSDSAIYLRIKRAKNRNKYET